MKESLEVSKFIDALKSPYKELFEELRKLISDTIPDVEEKVSWNTPMYYKGKKGVCYISVAGDHVNFGFMKGADLDDRYKLLEGTGKGMRHIKLWKIEDIDEEKFSLLLRMAYEMAN